RDLDGASRRVPIRAPPRGRAARRIPPGRVSVVTVQLSPQQVAELLQSTSALLEAELGALGDEEARWHPAPGEWCANEVVGHLIEAERRGFNGRIKRILDEDNPRIEPWDQIAVAKARNDCARMT